MTWQLVSEMLTSATPSIANHLWQSTAFLATAWLLTLALRKNQARVRYWLWLAASVKFLIPFALLISLGSSLSRPGNAAIAQSGLYSAVEEVSLPFTQNMAPIVPPVSHTPRFAFLSLLPELLLAAWLFGFAAVLGLWWLRWRRVSAAMRSALPMSQGREVGALRQLERSAGGVRRPIAFLLSRDSLEPGIFGIVRPVLLWPAGISKHLDDAHLKAILAHEVWHVRRRDNLAAAMHMVVEAVFWFHPLVWWMGTRLVEERERACDEEVLRLGNQAQSYAEGILKTCEFCVGSPLTCVSGVTGADLKQRIVRIMTGQAERKLDFSRKLLLSAAGLMAVTVPIVFGLVHAAVSQAQSSAQSTAPDIVGTWQGTLHAGRDLRIQVKITKGADGKYKAQFFQIDQGGQPIPANSVTIEGSTVKMPLSFIGGKFEGTLSKEGNTIDGEWSQEPTPTPLPLMLTRATPETAWAIPTPPTPIPPMADNANPSFEVATIKPSKLGEGKHFGFNGREFFTQSASLDELLALAYGVTAKQIVNAPGWAGTDLYDIVGLPDAPGRPDITQMGIMMQKLLASRFQLKFNRETRVLSVYAITVAKDGPKMTKDAGSANGPPAFAFRRLGNMFARNMTMKYLALVMQSTVLDRPVVDQTGLTGGYDFTLNWTPDDSQFTQLRGDSSVMLPTNSDASALPDLYTAIHQQLGLNIEPTKAPDEVIVIDHVEKPSPN